MNQFTAKYSMGSIEKKKKKNANKDFFKVNCSVEITASISLNIPMIMSSDKTSYLELRVRLFFFFFFLQGMNFTDNPHCYLEDEIKRQQRFLFSFRMSAVLSSLMGI